MVSILSLIAYVSLAMAAVTAYLAITRSYKWHWIAGIGLYVFSFISGFTIGYYTLALCFVLWFLAAAHSYRMQKRSAWLISINLGFALWFIVSFFGLQSWIFAPLFLLVH